MSLIVVPTPVGNLGDMTERGLEALRNADLIACEDTRRTGKLLNHFGISGHLLSYHEHNERGRTVQILKALEEGKTVALVSDAGTPGVSDPGEVVLREAIEKGLDVDVLPGATAFVPALLLSGLPAQPFSFIGFLAPKSGTRKKQLQDYVAHPWTLIFYVSPHRVLQELKDMAEVLGDRPASLSREISKLHQETLRGTVLEIRAELEARGPRGEMVLVVAGQTPPVSDHEAAWAEGFALLDEGCSLKEVVKKLNEGYGIAKNQIKDRLLEHLRRQEEDETSHV